MRLHADFKALVEMQLEALLKRMHVPHTTFVNLLEHGECAAARRVLAQLQAIDDWATFAEMMMLRRAECEATVLRESAVETGQDPDTAAGVRASLVEAAAEHRLQQYEERALNDALSASAAEAELAADKASAPESDEHTAKKVDMRNAYADRMPEMPAAAMSLKPLQPLALVITLPPLPSLPLKQSLHMRQAAQPTSQQHRADLANQRHEEAEIERRAVHFAGLRSLLAARKAPNSAALPQSNTKLAASS